MLTPSVTVQAVFNRFAEVVATTTLYLVPLSATLVLPCGMLYEVIYSYAEPFQVGVVLPADVTSLHVAPPSVLFCHL